MTRVLSGIALLAIVAGTLWFLPPTAAVVLAGIVLLLAFIEYAGLARAAGIEMARVPAAVATLSTGGAVALAPDALPVVLMAAGFVIAVTGLAERRRDGALAAAGASGFAVLYLGAPLGALGALAMQAGREVVLLLLVVVMASDIAQYYGGRLLGRRLLAPVVSPKKTIEGAVCGVVTGAATLTVAGAWWLPGVPPGSRIVLGVTLAVLGIAGDLFESHLKRSSGMKDASNLIPGHGGVLDRLDALLFAAPVYYTVITFGGGGRLP